MGDVMTYRKAHISPYETHILATIPSIQVVSAIFSSINE